ncbi:hypothetical protein [Halobacteriovorax sp.]|uniref:hypothetical protein n=1 Tax=Halobacteriovorax sp. TaxID=2020862 RepID=UPI003AF2F919
MLILPFFRAITEAEYVCPKSVITKGKSFDFSGAQKKLENYKNDDNENIASSTEASEKEKQPLPCLGRYEGEPFSLYIGRRFYISFFELKNIQFLGYIRTRYKSFKYKLSLLVKGEYPLIKVSSEITKPKLFINYFGATEKNLERLKNISFKAFVSGRYHESNLSQENIILSNYHSCNSLKPELERLKGDLIKSCHEINKQAFYRYCLNNDNFLKDERCNLSNKYSHLEWAETDLCDRTQVKRNFKLVCLGESFKFSYIDNEDILNLAEVVFDSTFQLRNKSSNKLTGHLNKLINVLNFRNFLQGQNNSYINHYKLYKWIRFHQYNELRKLDETLY